MDKNLMSSSTSLMVLALLAEEDQYGYQLIQELYRRSDHTFELKEGTLYPILHRLERERAIQSYEKEAESGRKRKYYHITKKGMGLLAEKKQEWRMFTRKVEQVLGEYLPNPGV